MSRPPRADLRELRVLLDLDAPALVVGEVPVERVQLVQRHQVDVLLHELLRHEVARDSRGARRASRIAADPQSSPRAWSRRGHRPSPRGRSGRQQLTNRLQAIEKTRGVRGAHHHADADTSARYPSAPRRASVGSRVSTIRPPDFDAPTLTGIAMPVAGSSQPARRRPSDSLARLVQITGAWRQREHAGARLHADRLRNECRNRRLRGLAGRDSALAGNAPMTAASRAIGTRRPGCRVCIGMCSRKTGTRRHLGPAPGRPHRGGRVLGCAYCASA